MAPLNLKGGNPYKRRGDQPWLWQGRTVFGDVGLSKLMNANNPVKLTLEEAQKFGEKLRYTPITHLHTSKHLGVLEEAQIYENPKVPGDFRAKVRFRVHAPMSHGFSVGDDKSPEQVRQLIKAIDDGQMALSLSFRHGGSASSASPVDLALTHEPADNTALIHGTEVLAFSACDPSEADTNAEAVTVTGVELLEGMEPAGAPAAPMDVDPAPAAGVVAAAAVPEQTLEATAPVAAAGTETPAPVAAAPTPVVASDMAQRRPVVESQIAALVVQPPVAAPPAATPVSAPPPAAPAAATPLPAAAPASASPPSAPAAAPASSASPSPPSAAPVPAAPAHIAPPPLPAAPAPVAPPPSNPPAPVISVSDLQALATAIAAAVRGPPLAEPAATSKNLQTHDAPQHAAAPPPAAPAVSVVAASAAPATGMEDLIKSATAPAAPPPAASPAPAAAPAAAPAPPAIPKYAEALVTELRGASQLLAAAKYDDSDLIDACGKDEAKCLRNLATIKAAVDSVRDFRTKRDDEVKEYCTVNNLPEAKWDTYRKMAYDQDSDVWSTVYGVLSKLKASKTEAEQTLTAKELEVKNAKDEAERNKRLASRRQDEALAASAAAAAHGVSVPPSEPAPAADAPSASGTMPPPKRAATEPVSAVDAVTSSMLGVSADKRERARYLQQETLKHMAANKRYTLENPAEDLATMVYAHSAVPDDASEQDKAEDAAAMAYIQSCSVVSYSRVRDPSESFTLDGRLAPFAERVAYIKTHPTMAEEVRRFGGMKFNHPLHAQRLDVLADCFKNSRAIPPIDPNDERYQNYTEPSVSEIMQLKSLCQEVM